MSKTITVGRFDQEFQDVAIEDSETVEDALRRVGITLAASEHIEASSNAEQIEPGEIPRAGESYFIVQNHTAGKN